MRANARKHRRSPAPAGRSGIVTSTTVHPEVMAKAREVQRPGEKVVIVSATEVRLVPLGT